MKFNVHVYATTVIHVYGIDADRPAKACEYAENLCNLDYMFPGESHDPKDIATEEAINGGLYEGPTGFLVDVVGDESGTSRRYDTNYDREEPAETAEEIAELKQQLKTLIDGIATVSRNWESGDLAQAVRNLIDEAREINHE